MLKSERSGELTHAAHSCKGQWDAASSLINLYKHQSALLHTCQSNQRHTPSWALEPRRCVRAHCTHTRTYTADSPHICINACLLLYFTSIWSLPCLLSASSSDKPTQPYSSGVNTVVATCTHTHTQPYRTDTVCKKPMQTNQHTKVFIKNHKTSKRSTRKLNLKK